MKGTRYHQSGHVFLKGSVWYLRYREDVTRKGGSIERVQKCRRLTRAVGQYRSKRSVEVLAEETLRPLNDGTSTAESTMSLKWIAARLEMGTWTHVSNRLAQQKEQTCVNTKD